MAKKKEKSQVYRDQYNEKTNQKIKERLEELPEFCKLFFQNRDTQRSNQPSSLLSYTSDLSVYFYFLQTKYPEYAAMKMHDMPISCLERPDKKAVKEFFNEFLMSYTRDGVTFTNGDSAAAKKHTTLKAFYSFFYNEDLIETDIVTPLKIVTHDVNETDDTTIINLKEDEIAILLDCIDKGVGLPTEEENKQFAYSYKQNRLRDLAMVTLLLGTGIRISECIGINVKDIDWNDGSIEILRKRNRLGTVYMNDEVEKALRDYINAPSGGRSSYAPDENNDEALFLTTSHKRMTVRTAEIIVKKYAGYALGGKSKADKITPHKLRSTFGTRAYSNEGDLKAVADALGHRDIQVTQTHYSAADETRQRLLVKNMKLRDA